MNGDTMQNKILDHNTMLLITFGTFAKLRTTIAIIIYCFRILADFSFFK